MHPKQELAKVVFFLAIDGGKRNRRMGLLRFGHLASLS
jgi:hypothetical protein